LLNPSWTALSVAGVSFVAVDWRSQLSGNSLFAAAVLDETAHLLTALLVVWALGRSACERFLVPALFASVAIDIDHVPGRLGVDWLTAGTPRPYTHSLLAIALPLAAAALWRRRGDLLLGVALGLTVHFLRDLSEPGTGVSLLWPVSYHLFNVPHECYLVAVAALIAVNLMRRNRLRTQSQTHLRR
jgi:inner membrane protein